MMKFVYCIPTLFHLYISMSVLFNTLFTVLSFFFYVTPAIGSHCNVVRFTAVNAKFSLMFLNDVAQFHTINVYKGPSPNYHFSSLFIGSSSSTSSLA